MEKLNILVLGDGLLGGEIVKQTGWQYLSRKLTGFNIHDFMCMQIPKDTNVIVNCIACTDTYSNDRNKLWDVNYAFVKTLIDYCNSSQIKLVHISTDYLYANSVEDASENDVPVHCNNWYGYTKLLADGLVQLMMKDYLLIRGTHKPKLFPYDKAWIDQIGNFDYVDVIASQIIKLINKGSRGVFNVGTDKKSMYSLALQTNPNVESVEAPINTPKNTTMNVSKMEKELNDDSNSNTYIPE